jgi:hypothetical protein
LPAKGATQPVAQTTKTTKKSRKGKVRNL